MRGTENIAHILVVATVLICIANNEPDWTTGRLSFEHPRKHFHAIRFIPGCRNATLSGAATFQLLLNKIQVDRDACRHSVDDSSNGIAVALAKGRQLEYVSKCITHQ